MSGLVQVMVGDGVLGWRIYIGKWTDPNAQFLGSRNNHLYAIPLIKDNPTLDKFMAPEWCFETLRSTPHAQYAVRDVSTGLYWSPVAYDLSAIELSANRAAWEIVSAEGFTSKFRLANSNLVITSKPGVERAFLFEQSLGTKWTLLATAISNPTPTQLTPTQPIPTQPTPTQPILTQPMLQKLANYRTIFLLDDSPSMFARPWAVVTEDVAAIVDKAIQLSAITEFDLQFVDNFRDNKESLKSGTEATSHMVTIRPSSTPSDTIREAIEQIVEQAISEAGSWNVIILTDTTRMEDSQPTRAVARFKRLLQKVQRSATTKGIPAYGIGIQLVQFNSSVDFQPVKTSNRPNNPVYFDTINFSAPLSTPLADKTLQKIILGAIDPGINETSI
jgi:hypothetical protein